MPLLRNNAGGKSLNFSHLILVTSVSDGFDTLDFVAITEDGNIKSS